MLIIPYDFCHFYNDLGLKNKVQQITRDRCLKGNEAVGRVLEGRGGSIVQLKQKRVHKA